MKNRPWKVEYCNECDRDEGFRQWWEVTDGHKTITCESKKDAEVVCDLLNRYGKGLFDD